MGIVTPDSCAISKVYNELIAQGSLIKFSYAFWTPSTLTFFTTVSLVIWSQIFFGWVWGNKHKRSAEVSIVHIIDLINCFLSRKNVHIKKGFLLGFEGCHSEKYPGSKGRLPQDFFSPSHNIRGCRRLFGPPSSLPCFTVHDESPVISNELPSVLGILKWIAMCSLWASGVVCKNWYQSPTKEHSRKRDTNGWYLTYQSRNHW